MTFRPWFIYIACVCILIGCVSGIHDSGESCKSSADYFGNTKLYHTLLDEKLRKLVGHAAKRASNAHNQLANVHCLQANFFYHLADRIPHFTDQNYTHRNAALRYQTAHIDAMLLHRGRATEHASHRRDIVTGNDAHDSDDLLALKRQFELSEQHATAGLTCLEASNAYKKAQGHAKRARDRAGTLLSTQNMITQSRYSLKHTPANAANFNPEDTISNARNAKQHANLMSRQFMQQLQP